MSDDFAELHSLSRDLDRADEQAVDNVEKALKVTSMSVKKSWQKNAARTGLKGYAASVDFEVKRFAAFGGAAVESEIGPNLSRSVGAPSFGFVEDAPGGVKSAPQHAGRDALADNADDFEKGISIAIGDLLDGLNL